MIVLKTRFLKFLFILFFSLFLTIFSLIFFSNILSSEKIIIDIGFHKIYLYPENKSLWILIKNIFIYSTIYSSIIISKRIFTLIFNNQNNNSQNKNCTNNPQNQKNDLFLTIGKDNSGNIINIPEKGLYQNILITGSIGCGKTSSAMYPFTKQLISYCSNNFDKKIGMLILDVKGNYYKKVIDFANTYNRENDVVIIEINGLFKYNPLHKPNLKESVIANQLKTILTLFSPNNSESYWLDKSEQILSEAIKFCRLYNDGYVTFEELHKIITQKEYFQEKEKIMRNKFINNSLSKEENYNLLSCLNFFYKEFFALDERTLNILKSEITRITNPFVSDYNILHSFCCSKEDLNFQGFSDIIDSGKIVVLNMNINEYRNLSKIISAYLKIDFQTAVLSQIANGKIPKRITSFISDEYSQYVTINDADFFSQSREAKCINIIATQSYTSLLSTLNNPNYAKVIIYNLINKIWFRNDDTLTIEEAQKQCGKTETERISKSISENAKETNYSYISNSLHSKNSNISESINKSYQLDFMYDTNYFTQKLETFSALCFLSDGINVFSPQKLHMFPYFKNNLRKE